MKPNTNARIFSVATNANKYNKYTKHFPYLETCDDGGCHSKAGTETKSTQQCDCSSLFDISFIVFDAQIINWRKVREHMVLGSRSRVSSVGLSLSRTIYADRVLCDVIARRALYLRIKKNP